MKKMNNKGFSLVELLAAIAILAILMVVATQAYNSYKKQARQQAYDTMAKSATVAATNYLMENTKAKYITFETLKEGEYVDTLQDPRYKERECTGIVINKEVQGNSLKQLDVLFQKVKLCCKNYKYQYDYTGDEVVVTEIDSCEYVEGDEIAGVYKLIYKTQGGTSCDPSVVIKNQGEEWGSLCVTTKENSVFKGWNTKKNGSGSTITEHTKVGDKDVNAYAIWSKIYTLEFNEEGGTTCDPKEIKKESGEKWGTLCSTEKSGYAFKGWNTKKDGSGSTITKNTYAEKDLKLYAKWNPYYTLTYDVNGGTECNPNSITKEKGEEWGTLCNSTKTGYDLSAWKNDTTTITSTTKASGNITVKAEWTKKKYKLTYDSNGGSTCNPITKEYNEAWGTLCTPKRTGYTFVGWKNGTTTITSTTKATANITVTAEWSKNNYTLTYDSNGGSTCNPASVTKAYNETWGTLCVPTRTGYEFNGWKNGTTTVTSTSKATANITVTAQWTANKYTLKYNDNNGSGCSSESITKDYNTAWGTLCTPKRTGYTFAGWKNGTTTVTSTSKATADITVTAQWSTQQYTLTYNDNNGSGCSSSSITKDYNTAWGTLCTPTRTGYTFTGWKNGTTTVTSTSKATADITVTAQWSINSYTLKYNDNNGSGCSSSSITKNYNVAWGTLCTPTRSGYTFAGWKNGSTTVTSTSKATADITVTAQWTAQQYTLKYNDNNGSGCSSSSITKAYNTAWGTLCTPTRTGYTFTGWKNGSTTVTSTSKATADITVTAQWSINSYTLKYNDNNGSGCSSSSITKNYNVAWGTLCTPTRSGYSFAGWKNGSTTVTSTSKATADITVTAQWTALTQNTFTGTAYLYDYDGSVTSGYNESLSCTTYNSSCTDSTTATTVSTRSGSIIKIKSTSFTLSSKGQSLSHSWAFSDTYYYTDSTTGVAGLNARSGPGTSYGIVDGLNVGHSFYPASKFSYDSSSSCPNHIWVYGYSYEEGWYGWVCSYYLY